jgi:UDP-N-acetylglucosamine--N-acetylmuramyl-(pentapeptide) pyrophosphoryl-undecaprenol N-acetylglucosamine transferase
VAARVVIAGGGTAGHVLPGLVLGRVLRERGLEVCFIGTQRGIEARLVPESGFELRLVPALPLVRKVSPAAVRAPVVALRAVRECRGLVRGGAAVVGMGGYVSVPAVLAARREGVPAVLHEQNAVPGLANRVLSRLSQAVAVSFADAAASFPRRVRVRLTGNPVRPEIVAVPLERDRLSKEARDELGLEEGRRTVVVFGGSQGALSVNRAAVGACRLLARRSDLQVLLIAGPSHVDDLGRALPTGEPLLVRLLGYLDRMELAYSVADLVVARAGAMSIAEITVCGLPAILIPYPHATAGHQEANARALQRAGGASLMLDSDVSAEPLAERILTLIDHDERLRATADRSRRFGRPDAGEALGDLVTLVAYGRRP